MPDECVNTQTYGYGLCLCDEESFVCECQPCRLCDSGPFCAGHTSAEWDAHCKECPLCAEERMYEGEVNFLFHLIVWGNTHTVCHLPYEEVPYQVCHTPEGVTCKECLV